MSVPASSAQIPTGHAHSVNRSGGDQERQHQPLSLPPIKLEVEAEAPREE
ncbi:hypothetical protein BD560DRAFT_430440 [Blakeslea trispora]|nr:hypothetical protein BD560DRAFT_430440 [Blakeslea trispora]